MRLYKSAAVKCHPGNTAAKRVGVGAGEWNYTANASSPSSSQRRAGTESVTFHSWPSEIPGGYIGRGMDSYTSMVH